MKNKQEYFRRRCLLRNAQNIKAIALQCRALKKGLLPNTSDGINKDFILTAQQTVREECLVLEKLFDSYESSLMVDDLFHSRVEYLISVVSFLADATAQSIGDEGGIQSFVPHLFKLFRVVQKYSTHYNEASKVENDVLSITNTISPCDKFHDFDVFMKGNGGTSALHHRGSSWFDVCLGALSMALVRLLALQPAALQFVNVSFTDAVNLCLSQAWEIQYFGLGVIFAQLRLEEQRTPPQPPPPPDPAATTALPASTSTSTSTSVSTSTKKSRRESFNAKAPSAGRGGARSGVPSKSRPEAGAGAGAGAGGKALLATKGFKRDELFRNGFLRTLVSLCAHEALLVRQFAAQALAWLLDHTPAASSPLASCLVEQGVVVMLEHIAQGVAVNDFGAEGRACGGERLFPEPPIRAVARRYLAAAAASLFPPQPSDLATKLLASLSFSGNFRLRLNILATLLSLRAHAPHSSLSPASLAPTFQSYLAEVLRDDQELERVLRLVLNVLRTASLRPPQQQPPQPQQQPQDRSAKTVQIEASEQDSSLLSQAIGRLHPVVVVGQASGAAVKMVCPPAHTIAHHCPALATAILSCHRLQLSRALQAYAAVHSLEVTHDGESLQLEGSRVELTQCEKEFAATLNNLPESEYFRIDGPYGVWQELFSHMTGDYVLGSTINRMATELILELMHLAALRGMPQLLRQYVEAILPRITLHTIPLILSNAILDVNGGDARLQLTLCVACFEVLLKEHGKLPQSRKVAYLDSILPMLTRVLVILIT